MNKRLARSAFACLVALAVIGNALGDEGGEITAAKSAESDFHRLCDEWASASANGKATADITRRMFQSQSRFVSSVLGTHYIPAAAIFWPAVVCAAGEIVKDDGHRFSYYIGGDPSDIGMWIWERAQWTPTSLPRQGFAAYIQIPAEERSSRLVFGAATRTGAGSATVFHVPYRYGALSGIVEFRVADFSVRPDRGIVDAASNWHIEAPPATAPAMRAERGSAN